MNDSNANALLAEASKEKNRLRRHLLVAAALREALPNEPIIVGGTAEEFWTAQPYHETDLDVCVQLRREDEQHLAQLGFAREGRHWIIGSVAVEIPETKIDGDYERTVLETVGGGAARVIGVDDLYVDRLRQSTARESVEGVEYQSAFAVAATCYDIIDWRYVGKRIKAEGGLVGESMDRIHARIRRRARRQLRSR